MRKDVLKRIIVAAGFLCLASAPGIARAQETTPDAHDTRPETSERDTRPRQPTRLYFGMWTMHLRDDTIGLKNNWAIGLASHGFFGGTFMNSFGRRGFTGGLQRTIVSTEPAVVSASLGFRLGVVSGYDGRFMRLARETPVLPLLQPFVTIDVGHLGVEISYTFVIVSTAMSYRF
jgi:hypothetical protein